MFIATSLPVDTLWLATLQRQDFPESSL